MWWEIEPTGFNEPIASVGLGEVTHFEYVRMPIMDMGLGFLCQRLGRLIETILQRLSIKYIKRYTLTHMGCP